MVARELDSRFLKLLDKINDGKNISRILLHTIPNIESEIRISINDDDILRVLLLIKEGKIAKEGIEKALIQSSRGEEIETGGEHIEKDVEMFIEKLINEKIDFVRERGIESVGPLMGSVMSEFRGKMDGAKINALLIKGIKKVI